MYAVVRRYPAGSKVIDAIIPKRAEIETLLRGVPGFVAYYAVKAAQGGATVTVCADRAGTEESTRRAANWVRENLAGAAGNQPEVIEGDVVMDFSK
jgi:hypothetical protein